MASDLVPLLVGVYVSMCLLTLLVIGLRLYSRIFIVNFLGWDDWTILAAGCLSIVVTVLGTLRVKYGLGHHVTTVPLSAYGPNMRLFYFVIIIYYLAQGLVKISILFLYMRIFKARSIQRACWIALTFVILYTITCVILSIFTCTPIAAFWEIGNEEKCLPSVPLWYSLSGLNIATDIGVFVLPLPTLFRLQMPTKQKIGLVGIFSIGFFACAISILRLHTLKLGASMKDPTWQGVDPSIWSSVELAMGIVCACLGTIKPLIVKFIPKFSSIGSHYASGAKHDVQDSAHRPINSSNYQRVHSGSLANGQTSTEHLSKTSGYPLAPVDTSKKKGMGTITESSIL